MEPVEIHNTTRLSRSKVEEHVTLSAEVGHVVCHLQGIADGLPLLAVKTVEEGSFVGAVTEIVIYPEPHLRLIERLGLNVLSFSIFLVFGTMHYELQLSVLLLDAYEAIATLEGCQTGPIAVFHL